MKSKKQKTYNSKTTSWTDDMYDPRSWKLNTFPVSARDFYSINSYIKISQSWISSRETVKSWKNNVT